MKTALVVTSISSPNKPLLALSKGAKKNDIRFIIIGDTKSPKDFKMDGCEYLSIDDQLKTDLLFASLCPEKSYSRKNIGYLLAMKGGADIIIETDDDNIPRDEFWKERVLSHSGRIIKNTDWINIYSYFTKQQIWPRGFPLEYVKKDAPPIDDFAVTKKNCPIQQGLADENPDVDALYRLLFPLPVSFDHNENIILSKNSVCPFNSQNTTFFKQAFPLMYLPSYCSFRMTDIWRSFVANRICSENGWGILFHGPTVWQDRNEHNLLHDFSDEISGYLNNDKIYRTLSKLQLKSGEENIAENLVVCYEELISMELVDERERELLRAWNSDIVQEYKSTEAQK